MNPTKKQLREARCAVDGHEWVVDHYTDALHKPTDTVVLAAWMNLRCQCCGAQDRVWNPAVDMPPQPPLLAHQKKGPND